MKDFTKLKVWEKSHTLTIRIYGLTKEFPGDAKNGLTARMRQAAASIPVNLAVGSGRNTDERARCIESAFGAACEVEYHLVLSRDLGYMTPDMFETFTDSVSEVKRMLAFLTGTLRTDN
jgi:four helix bundle protein